MNEHGSSVAPAAGRGGRRALGRWCSVVAVALGLIPGLRAELQFDVFVGYDGIVREANWFPVVFEVLNDGPPFEGILEFAAAKFGGAGQTRRLVAELPTNTRKRFVIPAYPAGSYATWDARLLDTSGKVRKDYPNLQPKRSLLARSFLLGAVPRSFGGLPSFPELQTTRPEVQPSVAHLRPELFPDNPIALEGLDALYVNTEKALELNVNQVKALLAWVYEGGHLIVGVEQPGDLGGLPWLRNLLPCELTGVTTRTMQGEIQVWLTRERGGTADDLGAEVGPSPTPQPFRGPPPQAMSPQMRRRYGLPQTPGQPGVLSAPIQPYQRLSSDPIFDLGTLPLATGTVHDGEVLLGAGGLPLVVRAPRGRGLVTVLTFSPEREPFRSWKNRSWFWAKVSQVPPRLLVANPSSSYGGWSIDGVFGSMIDSKQVRKLPVSWLLLLLLVYLAVIGPVDQYCLKKLNKQMLTWITFPIYVVLFSGLIYLIGYKLRAGETEYNELHVVDILPSGTGAQLRGRTFASVYSPANAKFRLAGEQQFATLRGESQGFRGGQESSDAQVEHHGNGYRAEIFVPVWTSRLFVNDWWQASPTLPVSASLKSQGDGYQLTVKNNLLRPLSQVRLVLSNLVYSVGELAPQESRTVALPRGRGGLRLTDFVLQNANQFQAAVQERGQAFGRDPSSRLWDMPSSTMAASFLAAGDPAVESQRNVYGGNYYGGSLLTPHGLDLTELTGRGEAVLLAWDSGGSLTRPIQQFTPRRSRHDTLLRLAIPLTTTHE